MPVPRKSEIRTLADASSGDIVALASDLVTAGYCLSAGQLLRVGWHKDAATFARFIIPAGPDQGEWSSPIPMRGSAPCKLVSTCADRNGAAAVDSTTVRDPLAGVPVEASGGLPGMGQS